ncbi:MAG: peptide-methionine (R)-S-oxide reductase MsrB [Planctomycetota bacterium]|nr:peptide-methionine (R)-S-oxide reductase MsrB [Planctomycetota bacterium]
MTQPKLEIPDREKWQLSEEEWKKRLTPEQFHVLRKSGTERACTGAYWEEKRVGVFFCAGCGLELFTSDTKYESGTGWPSFFQPVKASYVEQSVDHKLGYPRNEVHCGRCGGHLGHVFTDGPKPTGLRYCINSASLRFVPKEGQEAKTGAQAEAKTPEAQK